MLKKLFTTKERWGISETAIRIGKSTKKSINTNIFSMAEDLKERKGTLFESDRDVFSGKPLKISFKWSKK